MQKDINMGDFRCDINVMLNNVLLLFGCNSYPASQVSKLEQDLSSVWQLQENVPLLNLQEIESIVWPPNQYT